MSLINQMLKDLEARRTPELPGGTALPAAGAVGRRGAHTLITLLAVVIALLALTLAYLLWERLQGVPPPQGGAVAASAPPPAAPVPQRPQPAAAPQSPAVAPRATAAASEPVAVAMVPPSRLDRVLPEQVVGGWQPQRLLLKGKNLTAADRALVLWGSGEKLLGAEQIEYLDAGSIAITLTTGIAPGPWQVRLVRADGSQSEAVGFRVEPPPAPPKSAMSAQEDPAEPAEGAESEVVQHIEKRIRPLSTMERAEQHYRQGYQALQQSHQGEAVEAWRRALAIEERHAASREGLVGLYLTQGRTVEATQLLERGVILHPGHGRFALLYARLLNEQGKGGEAIAALERAAAAAAQGGDLYALLAALYQREGRYAQSVSSYQRALQLEPQQGTWWMGIGISLEREGQKPEAMSAYQEALKRGNLGAAAQRYVEQRLEALR